jgi:hypothetical protein
MAYVVSGFSRTVIWYVVSGFNRTVTVRLKADTTYERCGFNAAHRFAV